MGWISPTGFVDGGGVWTDEALAYDENTGTYAYTSISNIAWSDYLELTVDAITCDKVQVWSDRTGVKVDLIEVDVYYNSAWDNIYSGVLAVGSFQEYAIGSSQTVTAMRVRYHHNQNGKTKDAHLIEADFWEVPSGPTPDAFNKIFYTDEPPTPNAWNQVKREAGTGYKKLLYT